MYDDMSEAITLYYEVMKGYEAAKKARRGKKNKAAGPVTLDEVLLKVCSSSHELYETLLTDFTFSVRRCRWEWRISQ